MNRKCQFESLILLPVRFNWALLSCLTEMFADFALFDATEISSAHRKFQLRHRETTFKNGTVELE